MSRKASSKVPQGESVIYAHALIYHSLGWSIVPIASGTKQTPDGMKWKQYQTERATREQLLEWFVEEKHPGLAVILGDVSGGLLCRDFDSMPSYNAWSRDNSELAATLATTATGRTGGGRHVFFYAESGAVEKASPTGSCKIKLPNGAGELLGPKHLAVLPPTRHAETGTRYEWMKYPDCPHLADFKRAINSILAKPTAFEQEQPSEPRRIPIDKSGFVHGKSEIVGLSSILPTFTDSLSAEGRKRTHDKPDNTSNKIPPPPAKQNQHDNNGTNAENESGIENEPAATFADISDAAHQRIERFIKATIPKIKGTRNLLLFTFSRMLHDIPEIVDRFSEARGNLKELNPIVQKWFDEAIKYDRKRKWVPTLVEFRHGYSNVAKPYSKGSLSMIAKSIEGMTPPQFAVDDYGSEPLLVQMVLLCRELQKYHGENPFYLGCKDAAFHLKLETRSGSIDKSRANRWLIMLCQDGILQEVKKGTAETRTATEYRYLPPVDE